jgi:WD40 repeat protein
VALYGHLGAISDVALSPDGAQASSVGAGGTIRVWALRRDDLVAIAEGGRTRTLTDPECPRYLHADREPARSDRRSQRRDSAAGPAFQITGCSGSHSRTHHHGG